jgi:hypothetical protein
VAADSQGFGGDGIVIVANFELSKTYQPTLHFHFSIQLDAWDEDEMLS